MVVSPLETVWGVGKVITFVHSSLSQRKAYPASSNRKFLKSLEDDILDKTPPACLFREARYMLLLIRKHPRGSYARSAWGLAFVFRLFHRPLRWSGVAFAFGKPAIAEDD
jgi:hypothetical protein